MGKVAFGAVKEAELWIVGNPRMSVEPLHELAALTGAKVRFVTRFVEEAEIPAIFRRADVVALPYLDAEHSGVLYTGLAFGKPLLCLIDGPAGLNGYRFDDDDSSGVWLETVERFPRGLVIGVDPDAG